MSSDSNARLDRAEELFASFVTGPKGGDGAAFEELCAEHPDLDAELRKLRDDLEVVGRLLGESSAGSGLVNRLRGQPADGVAEEARMVFNDFLIAGGNLESEEFTKLQARYPEYGEDLRSLAKGWAEVEAGFAQAGEQGRDMHLGSTLFLRQESDGKVKPGSFNADQLLARLLDKNSDRPRYLTERQIGAGGMGEIAQVWDTTLRRHLAMKRIRADRGPGDVRELGKTDPLVARFMEEAQVTSQLNHPGIVPIHDLGVDEKGNVFFTMQLVKGRDLVSVFDDVWAERDGWSVTRALGVLQRVCEAVAYAHEKDVLHRDLKPANVMVGRFGETYVMDWGLARLQGDPVAKRREAAKEPEDIPVSIIESDRRATQRDGGDGLYSMEGDVKGTPNYMPLEQANGKLASLSPATDVYAIGAMLYHLLTQRAPYTSPGRRLSGQEVVERVRAGAPDSLLSIAPKTPPELVSICELAMAREAVDRYQNTKELGDDLRAFLEDRVVRAHRTGPFAEFHKWTVRNRGAAVSLGGGIAIALSGLGFTAADQTVKAAAAKTEAVQAEEVAVAAVQEKEVVIQEKETVIQEKAAVQEKYDLERELRMKLQTALGTIDEQKAELARLTKEREAAAELMQQQAAELAESTAKLEASKGELAEREAALQQAVTKRQEALAEATAAEQRALSLEGTAKEAEAAAKAAREAKVAAEQDLVQAEDNLAQAKQRLAPVEDDRRLGLLEYQAKDAWPLTPDLAPRFVGWLAEAQDLIAGLEGHRARLAALSEDTPERQVLSDLVPKLEAFAAADGRYAEIQRRVAQAEGLERTSVLTKESEWSAALASIADPAQCPAYGGLVMEPIAGLVPLGINKQGLWEFTHVLTGGFTDGPLALGDGLVMVLIPGGSFDMGSYPEGGGNRLGDPNVALDVTGLEQPVHGVMLEPFLISKYEVTVDQWNRWPGRPGLEAQGADLEPATGMSWFDADRASVRLGLSLPTEAQWEYAARAGNGAPWWCVPKGAERDLAGYLEDNVNLADVALGKSMPPGTVRYERKLNDGFAGVTDVTALTPNGFGLYTVLGNVAEWCRDSWAAYSVTPRPGDALRADDARAALRLVRGGDYQSMSGAVRSGARAALSPGDARPTVGFRPVLKAVGRRK